MCVCVNVYMMGVWKASGSGYLKVGGDMWGETGTGDGETGRQGQGQNGTGRASERNRRRVRFVRNATTVDPSKRISPVESRKKGGDG